jgi:hypothetical protein
VLAIGDGTDLIGPEGDRAQGSKLWRVLKDVELANFEQRTSRLILFRHFLAASTRSLIERCCQREESDRNDEREPAGDPKDDDHSDQ